MIETQGQRLRRLRLAAGLSQNALADKLGVCQGECSRWERDCRSIPESRIEQVASALGVDAALLAEVRTPKCIGRPPCRDDWPYPVRKACPLPPYPVKGTLDEMLALGEVAEDALYDARRHFSQPDLANVFMSFPRDSAEELLATLLIMGLETRLCRFTLSRLRCSALVTDGHGSARTGMYYVRDSLVVVRGEVSLAMFPQVWVASVLQAEWYRLDFLTLVRHASGRQVWVDVEIDGQAHENTVDKDKRRARGIGLPRRGFWVSDVKRPGFGYRLIETLSRV